jgi:hypothetical protein
MHFCPYIGKKDNYQNTHIIKHFAILFIHPSKMAFIIAFDLETVYPVLETPTGLVNQEGNFCVDPHQVHCSRIWQLGCTSLFGDYEALIHPGFPLENLSESSRNFLKPDDFQLLKSIPREQTLAAIWPDFCQWLEKSAGRGAEIILVAQQANHGDEIVLAVEMARYNLKWPAKMRIYAVDALACIQQCFREHQITRTQSWTVSSIYKDLTGKEPVKTHRALEDARCLLANLKTCWGLKMLSNLGISYSMGDFSSLGDSVESMEWLFWATAPKLLDWKPETPKDHRQSVWALTTMTRKGYVQWPAELARELENRFSIYTISDLMQISKREDFIQHLCKSEIVKKNWRLIEKEVEYRNSRSRSRTPSPDGREYHYPSIKI